MTDTIIPISDEVSEKLQTDEMLAGWYDAILDAKTWFSLNNVTSNEAAMLLCQLNPFDKKCDPSLISNTETNHLDYYLLHNFFESISSQEKSMKLIKWLDLAKTNKLKYHSWIDSYIGVLKMTEPKHGGTRMGAGKPKATNPTKLRSIRLNDDDWVKFREIGGVKWLRRMIINMGTDNPNNG